MGSHRAFWSSVCDPAYTNDHERYVEYNFHDPEVLARLEEVVRGGPDEPRVFQLGGPEGVGRKYLLDAVVYQVGEGGTPATIAPIEMAGYECDDPKLEPLLDLLTRKYGPKRAEVAKKLLEYARVQAKSPLLPKCDAVSIELAVGFDLLLDGARRFFEPAATEPRPPQERLLALLDYVSQSRVVVLRCPLDKLDDFLLRHLVRCVNALPNLRLAITHEPQRRDVQIPDYPEAEYFELEYLGKRALRDAVRRGLSRQALDESVFDLLNASTHGHRDVLARRLLDLRAAGILQWDDRQGWHIDDVGKLHDALPAGFLDGIWDAVDAVLDPLDEPTSEQLRTFLRLGALCGERFPGAYLLHFMESEQEGAAPSEDLVRSTLTKRDDLLSAIYIQTPEFPDSYVYAFVHPAVRRAILKVWNERERRETAQRLLEFVELTTGVQSRGMARLCLELASVDSAWDSARWATYKQKLSWWIGLEEADAFIQWCAKQVTERELDPERLWEAFELGRRTAPWRRLTLLRAYERQPDGMPTHRRTRFCDAIGRLYAETGSLDVAEGYLAECRRRCELEFGYYHNDTLVSMNQLARVRQLQGMLVEAEKLLTETLDRQRCVLGADHPESLRLMNNLACVWRSQGKLAEAEKLFAETVDRQRRVLGANHPDTLMSMNNLAGVLRSQGKLGEAEKLHAETLDHRRRVLGERHADTIATRKALERVREKLK